MLIVLSLLAFLAIPRPGYSQTSDCEIKPISGGRDVDANFANLAACIKKLQARVDQAQIPDGAVLAFDTDKCPDGWEFYLPTLGRFVLGGFPPPTTSSPPRVLPAVKPPISSMKGSIGGTIFTPTWLANFATPQQLAQKSASAVMGVPGLFPENLAMLAPNGTPEVDDGHGGKVVAFNLAPPYVALLYCKKIPAHPG